MQFPSQCIVDPHISPLAAASLWSLSVLHIYIFLLTYKHEFRNLVTDSYVDLDLVIPTLEYALIYVIPLYRWLYV